MKNKVLTIWDSDKKLPAGLDNVYLWNGYTEKNTTYSLLDYIDKNSEKLRNKYLAWIHDLGITEIKGKPITEHFAYDEDLSFWWMTLFVEQSPWMTPVIMDVLRLFALEELFIRDKPQTVVLVSSSKEINIVITQLCKSLNIEFKWKKTSLWKPTLIYKKIIKLIPVPMLAFVSISKHILERWGLRKVKKPSWISRTQCISIFSYFIHLNEASCQEGKFSSEQWANLPSFLFENSVSINWVHHYLKSSVVPNVKVAKDYLNRFNGAKENNDAHSFLYSYLTYKLMFRVIIKWSAILLISTRIQRHVKINFTPVNSNLNLWPIMKDVWVNSLRGSSAVVNILWIELFDSAMKDMPYQNRGLYLFESQSWERALINAWRKNKHGELIAVVHSTVRFWDLRYYKDPRIIVSNDKYSMPQPDIVLLNGQVAKDAFLSVSFPKEKMAECEAIRYEYLFKLGIRKENKNKKISVLILGDYTAGGTNNLLSLLDDCSQHIDSNVSFTVKPHPSYPVSIEDYPKLCLSLVTGSLSSIISDYDLAYCSNMTSASVDAYLAGLPVIITLDSHKLNFSPLRNQGNISFVSSTEELLSALRNAIKHKNNRQELNNYFFLDPGLPRWRKILLSNKNDLIKIVNN